MLSAIRRTEECNSYRVASPRGLLLADFPNLGEDCERNRSTLGDCHLKAHTPSQMLAGP
jgi:hypothetical protein